MSRRSEGRATVEIAGLCVTDGANGHMVHVSDLSRNGCRIFCRDQGLREGQRVEIMLASVGPLPAQLRWVEPCVDGFSGGVRFDEPIHSALLDYFAAYCRVAG